MKGQNIEQLFKDALGNLEADVNPGVWTNIENGLQAPASVAGNSIASKSAGIFGKMGLKSLLIISAASVTLIGTIIYFAADKPESEKAEVSSLSTTKELVNTSSIGNKITTIPSDPVEKEIKNSPVKKQIAVETSRGNVLASVNAGADSHFNSAPKEPTLHPSAAPVIAAPKAIRQQEKPAITEKPSDVTDEKKAGDGQVDPKAENPKVQSDPVFDVIEKYLVADAAGKKELRNSFSPNGDGKNDIFSLETTDIKSLVVIIFDIAGRQVYSWNSLNGGWDGTCSNGKEAPEGNYFYSVNAQTIDGKICIAKSSLRLFRNSQN